MHDCIEGLSVPPYINVGGVKSAGGLISEHSVPLRGHCGGLWCALARHGHFVPNFEDSSRPDYWADFAQIWKRARFFPSRSPHGVLKGEGGFMVTE